MIPTTLSREAYENYIYQLREYHPSVQFSTLVIAPPGIYATHLSGLVGFSENIILCVHENLNFLNRNIVRYSYDVSRTPEPFSSGFIPNASEYCLFRYTKKEILYWYDSWPHPNDASLASTHPHHKHIHPEIKHHRIPAPGLSFARPNLPFLIEEIERELL
jgi:hypothetical protein